MLALLVAGGSATVANEVAYEVITESVNALDYENLTNIEEVEADLMDIFMDTDAGSYCESFAGANLFLITTAREVGEVSEFDAELYVRWIAAQTLVNELDSLGALCLNEE